jgi:retron-type reverse transcriptase
MAQVAQRVVDQPMLKLIRDWLRMGVLEDGVTSPAEAGTPQGSPISPLLANIALHVLDRPVPSYEGMLWAYGDDHPGQGFGVVGGRPFRDHLR